MENKLKDQVIYPKDLLFAALFRWRAAVIVGLVLAILLGGFQLRSMDQSNADQGAMDAYNKAVAEYESKKAALQDHLDAFEYEYDTEEAHLRESVYLNLDPYNHYRGTLKMYVHTNYQIQPDKAYQTPDITEHLLSSYTALMHNDNTIQTMGELIGLTWRQMYELYSVTYDANLNTVTVTISGADQKTVELLLDEVGKLMYSAEATLNNTIGTHELRLVYSGVDLVVDTNINTVSRDSWNHLNSLKEQIASVNDELAALQAPVYPAGGSSLKKAVIFAVLGFVAGVAIVAICAWFRHMDSD